MASFYAKTRKTASKLLGKFGAKVTITRTIRGEYDPSTGSYSSTETYTWTPFAVRTALKEEFMASTLIAVGDMQILIDCEGQPYMPEKGDSVTFADGETWRITQDMPVDPAGTVVLYKGIIRKG